MASVRAALSENAGILYSQESQSSPKSSMAEQKAWGTYRTASFGFFSSHQKQSVNNQSV